MTIPTLTITLLALSVCIQESLCIWDSYNEYSDYDLMEYPGADKLAISDEADNRVNKLLRLFETRWTPGKASGELYADSQLTDKRSSDHSLQSVKGSRSHAWLVYQPAVIGIVCAAVVAVGAAVGIGVYHKRRSFSGVDSWHIEALGSSFGRKPAGGRDTKTPPSNLLGETTLENIVGDRKLAHSAQMYHYQQQKQQMLAMERATETTKPDGSEEESEAEVDDADFTVFECPGLATTSEIEVKNPLFEEEMNNHIGANLNDEVLACHDFSESCLNHNEKSCSDDEASFDGDPSLSQSASR